MLKKSSRCSKLYETNTHRTIEEKIAAVIRRGHAFLVSSHKNPDGDSVGSSLALAAYLEKEGKDVLVFHEDPVPAPYRFMPGSERIRDRIPDESRFDVSFVVDCGSPQRVGHVFENFPFKGQLVIIDHHPPAAAAEGLRLVKTAAAATAELLYDVFRAYGAPLDARIATALYLALMTDTGSFRFSNTTSRALGVGAALLDAGADHGLLINGVYESFPPERYHLLGCVLPTLKLEMNGRIAHMTVTRAMYEQTGTSAEHTEGFVDFPRSIAGVEVAALIREVDVEEFRVSMRSRSRVNVGEVAASFGGGGHANAAGCTFHGKLHEVSATIVRVLRETLS
jgi:phosphoesterase RecJ-like protein